MDTALLATSPISRLFKKAQEQGGFQYLYTLVRVDGIQAYEGYRDVLIVLREWLDRPDTSDPVKAYSFLLGLQDPLELLQNLLNVSNGKDYQVRAFIHLKIGRFPHAVWPTTRQKIEALVTDARSSGFPELADQIAAGYRPDLLESSERQTESINAAIANLSALLTELLDCYFSERLEYKKTPTLIKLPRSLDVLELIIDEEFGLSGLRVHFSHNCAAEFIRKPTEVMATNIEFGPPVTFLMMSTEPSTNEYRVHGKRLYEIGLPGRYNKLGEWKPLVYPASSKHLIKECMELSEDPDVQGVLLYLRLTGHRCIEFVLRTNIDLPSDYTSTKERNLHIWKCPSDDEMAANTDLRIYDCWLELANGGVDEIEQGLSAIAYFVNVLCFPFGAAYAWRNKYRTTTGGSGMLTPSHEDMEVVDRTLKTFHDTPSASILLLGIDWYNRGNMSTNIFNRFLCYYIALESVAVAIAEGSELAITQVAKPTKAEKKSAAKTCIEAKYASLFVEDPIRFVNDSYFDCVQSLTSKTKIAVASVFGKGHPYMELLFEKSSGGDLPLKDLRSELAHGDVTLMDKQHEHLVRKHLYEMGRITQEFLLRILFRLNGSEDVPSWSGQFQQRFSTADPRSTMVASVETIFPAGTNWKIRPEWCE